MALLVCRDCTCAYSVGAPRCPECGSKRSAEQGSKNDPTLSVEAVTEQPEGGKTDA